jgi:hypothetical protein
MEKRQNDAVIRIREQDLSRFENHHRSPANGGDGHLPQIDMER